MVHLAAAMASNNNGSVTCNASQLSTTLPATNSRSDTSLISNDVRQRAVLSGWARKYFVVDIPPYCGQRGGDDDREDEGPEGINSWSPIITSSGTDSGEAMDCSSGREEEEELQRPTEACPM
ncbi:hypothetical protein OJAV_G00166840 [Oryzias javanicus]|uniref:Uncharacterized protein n=1 Tax=Oryzias javanicus TaxID=123683 RepID=A0A437CE03_ORYJA|nr:hypothetical protein OJAV_G00166840 [Oryzias javanicus]